MDTAVLNVDTTRRRIVDLTDDVRSFCASHGDGLCNVFVPHATAGVAVIEVPSRGACSAAEPLSVRVRAAC